MSAEGEFSPSCYAAGSLFVVPLIAALLFFAGVVLIAAWPIIPFLVYMERQKEAA
jgi:hypothetical protein